MLYTGNTFNISATDLPILFQQSPKACRLRSVKLTDTTPVDLHDQSDIEPALSPVDTLAERCDNLQTIMIPYTLGMKERWSKAPLR